MRRPYRLRSTPPDANERRAELAGLGFVGRQRDEIADMALPLPVVGDEDEDGEFAEQDL